jgi:hypothetical protein
MLKQRPKSPPLTFNRYARIQFEGSGAARDCLITAMSAEGVRLYSEIGEAPVEFTLVMSDGQPPRRCQTSWRLGFEFGAKFTDTARSAVSRRTTRAA